MGIRVRVIREKASKHKTKMIEGRKKRKKGSKKHTNMITCKAGDDNPSVMLDKRCRIWWIAESRWPSDAAIVSSQSADCAQRSMPTPISNPKLQGASQHETNPRKSEGAEIPRRFFKGKDSKREFLISASPCPVALTVKAPT
jgi:hypothetical protein